MYLLQIEHPVPNFEGWKKVFDSDPLNRLESGVKRYRIYRNLGEPNQVMVDLEFDDPGKAELMLKRLQKLWNQVEGTIITGPKARILEEVESHAY